MSMQHDTEAGLEAEQTQLATAEVKLLREELRNAAKHAGAPDPQLIVDQFLPTAKFVNCKIVLEVGTEKLAVRELVSRIRNQKNESSSEAASL